MALGDTLLSLFTYLLNLIFPRTDFLGSYSLLYSLYFEAPGFDFCFHDLSAFHSK